MPYSPLPKSPPRAKLPAPEKIASYFARLAELRPGRTMARIGLRMMPRFPPSSLSFRTAFSPVGLEGRCIRRACPFDYEFFASCGLGPPFVPILPTTYPRSEPRVCGAPVPTAQAASATLPQGSSLRLGLCCPGPSSLIDPMRPTRRHISISRIPLIRDALAVGPNCNA
jgi:hypothetical protein